MLSNSAQCLYSASRNLISVKEFLKNSHLGKNRLSKGEKLCFVGGGVERENGGRLKFPVPKSYHQNLVNREGRQLACDVHLSVKYTVDVKCY